MAHQEGVQTQAKGRNNGNILHTERMGLSVKWQGSNKADKGNLKKEPPWEQSAAFHWLGRHGPLHTSLLRRATGQGSTLEPERRAQ
jgi:hypothetical protein